jgi:2-octaprenylphenol hydroxylase
MRSRSAIIVGAGPVGLGLAALLLGNPGAHAWRVRLIEPRPVPQWVPTDLDLRVYALSRASQNILAAAGVWDAIATRRVSPYRRMVVWEGAYDAGIGRLCFDSAELGEPDLGHIVEDRLIRSCLIDALGASPGLDLTLGTGLEAVHVGVDRVEITVDTGATYDADVLIAADGSASTVRSLMRLPVLGLPYDQAALVAHVATQRPHAQTAWQRFLSTGPVALLPLADGRCSVVWSTSAERAEALREGSPDEFCAALTSATDGALGAIATVGERASFPLQVLHAREYCRARVALIGDAAHTVHPLAGQGMNLGLLDAAVLAEVLHAAVVRGEDPGDLRVLKRYERRQKGRNVRMLLAMDALHRLFTRAGPLLAPLRATGMTLINRMPSAKRVLMREALGLAGELPEAARPALV